MTTLPKPTPRDEPWPVWAKVLLIALALLVVLAIVPWVFMSWAMAATCAPMMGQMLQLMPGTMR